MLFLDTVATEECVNGGLLTTEFQIEGHRILCSSGLKHLQEFIGSLAVKDSVLQESGESIGVKKL